MQCKIDKKTAFTSFLSKNFETLEIFKITTSTEINLRIIRKYANRRLYDTEESRYIVLADLRDLVIENKDFVVQDSKSGEDLTRNILLQIIIEQENIQDEKSAPMFTNEILKRFISMYSQGVNPNLSNYMQQTLDIFYEQQKIVQENFKQAVKLSSMGQVNPTDLVKKMVNQNKILWEKVLESLNIDSHNFK